MSWKIGKEMDSNLKVFFDRTQNKFTNIEPFLQQFRERFPSVDVDEEIKKMGMWLQSDKGKNHMGTLLFITNWLKKAPPSKCVPKHEDALRELLNDYLKELWKNREHILLMNRHKG